MGDRLTIRCMYSCRLCGIQKASLDVPARGDDEEVGHWVGETCARAIGEDHAKRSPGCSAQKIDEVWIPINGAPRVGDPAVS